MYKTNIDYLIHDLSIKTNLDLYHRTKCIELTFSHERHSFYEGIQLL